MSPAVSRHIRAVVLCLVIAAAARWPMSFYLDAIQTDPNTPLHVMIARDLTRGGSPFWIPGLEFPTGIPVRVIAAPLIAIAAALNLFLDPVPAFNVAVTLWLAGQGYAMHLLGGLLGWSTVGRSLAAAAVIFAPATLFTIGNGQFEHVVYVALVLAVVAATRGGWWGLAAAAGAGLLAAFSSPYQGIVCAVVMLVVAAAAGWRRMGWMLGGLGIAFVAAFAYYIAVSSGQLHLYAAPAAGLHAEPAGLLELVAPMPHRVSRFDLLWQLEMRTGRLMWAPGFAEFSPRWQWYEPFIASYAGVALVVLGGVGLWRARRDRVVMAIALSGALCLVLALGAKLHLSSTSPTPVPLPWALASWVPGLQGMQATTRFLTGTTFALAVGIAHLLPGRAWGRAGVILGLLAVDGLLMAPSGWPLPALRAHTRTLSAELPAGPVMVWPSAPTISPNQPILLGLLLDRPIALFTGVSGWEEGPDPGGVEVPNRITRAIEEDHHGRSPDVWLSDMNAAGVHTMVQFDMGEHLAFPLPGREVAEPAGFVVVDFSGPSGPSGGGR